MLIFGMSLEKDQDGSAKIEELVPSLQQAPANDLLSIAPRQYREYADEWKRLARAASDIQQRAYCLKTANMWLYAAIRYEAGLGASDSS